jgi:hypothetical protein
LLTNFGQPKQEELFYKLEPIKELIFFEPDCFFIIHIKILITFILDLFLKRILNYQDNLTCLDGWFFNWDFFNLIVSFASEVYADVANISTLNLSLDLVAFFVLGLLLFHLMEI